MISLWVWTGVGIVIYLLLILGAKKLPLGVAEPCAMLSCGVALYAIMPLIVLIPTGDFGWFPFIAIVVGAAFVTFLCSVPMRIIWGRREARAKIAETARAEEAEEVIRRFGA